MGISAETDLNILWESATILRGGRFFHTQNQEEVNNMKEFWNVKAADNRRIELDAGFCLQCGALLTQTPGRKRVKFCSDNCRTAWWNAHPEKVNRRAIYHFTCAHCGKPFTAYGNAKRKYCSHACYIADRYKGGDGHE